jgi:hypothetical protein
VPGSDHAELATLRSQLDELTSRIVAVGDRYRGTPDSAITGDLETTERALIAARRSLARAIEALDR